MRRFFLFGLMTGGVACSSPGPGGDGALTAGITPSTTASSMASSSTSPEASSEAAGPGSGATLDPSGGTMNSSESTGMPLPPLPCDEAFSIDPVMPDLGPIGIEVEHPEPLSFVELNVVSGPNVPTTSFIDLVGSEPYRWAWEVTGHAPGEYTLEFGNRADEGAPFVIHSTCQIRVEAGGSGSGTATDSGECTCADKGCGEDDGCGTPCSGGHRDENGAISDCRLEGNCGCGVEPNDNMECTGDGQCRVRCSCDCLPPIDVDPAEVAGLDFGGSCAYVFEASGDPTVWDATNGVALCPLDYDPQGAARCTECPPCHRPQAPECEWEQYCTCTAPMYYEEYSKTCCNAGAEYCY